MGGECLSLHSGFLRSVELFPERIALEVGGEALTFVELRRRAVRLAATLDGRGRGGRSGLTAVFAERSPTAFVAVLGSLFAGNAYVPLSPGAPAARNRSLLERSTSRTIVADRHSAEHLHEVVEGFAESLLIVLPEHEDVECFARRWPTHHVVGSAEMASTPEWSPAEVTSDFPAYLLFTSGSTGLPKGVMVTHGNARHLVDSMVDRYGVNEHDRFSQMFDMTFDLSVFDMFVAWEVGACVCCPSGNALVAPAEFIQSSELTVWFSVPSTAIIMKRLRLLKPGRYPTLRWSLFCGEALPSEIARSWADAAPSATIENLYGPTEATVACTAYRWDPERAAAESELGLVPIGAPLPGMSTKVVDESLLPVPFGEPGELLVAGPQVADGYWRDADRTAAAFVVPPDENRLHYRTGDRVRASAGGPLCYLGRLDNQIKLHGHRVELGEVEANLRDVTGVDAVVAVGWPTAPGGASGIVAFLGADSVDVPRVRAAMARRLPDYMVPRRVEVLPALPTNANGKFDRRALLALLEDEE